MSTLRARRIVQEVVFGPFESRRFGKSLGVNPLPRGSRFCNFDCIYCECGSSGWPLQWELRPQFPEAEDVRRALVSAADALAPADIDTITIAGNGEPTLSPHLDAIVDVVTEARDRDWPGARTVILTNGTTAHRSAVHCAVAKLDERVVKFDAGTNWLLEQINRPSGELCVAELIRRISMMPDIVIQSMFVHGPVDNARPEHVHTWAEWLKRLAPMSVQIYSLDRQPANSPALGSVESTGRLRGVESDPERELISWVRQVTRHELETIAAYLESAAGVPAHVY